MTEPLDHLNFQKKARRLVFWYVKPRLEKTDSHVTFSEDEVYVVWFAKTLQNWKALVSTTLPDGMYYEVTYNGDDKVTYLDAYKKFDNVFITDSEADLMASDVAKGIDEFLSNPSRGQVRTRPGPQRVSLMEA